MKKIENKLDFLYFNEMKNHFFNVKNENSGIFSVFSIKASVVKMSVAQCQCHSKKSGNGGFINGIPIRKVYVAPIIPQVNDRLHALFHHFILLNGNHNNNSGYINWCFIFFRWQNVSCRIFNVLVKWNR